ncbi:MAG: A/G-specific adenine glycosylase [Propionibacteriales bacterium]|nr:A/G-specific adenine glycosylase [Propionibacteriales bacterium]
MPESVLHRPLLAWYDEEARDLPWRQTDTTPWAVMVSEFMLQQTPVSRVLPVYETWLRSWPTPSALAADSPGEAVRAWGRLGYPRRALRLHGAATAIRDRHGGAVPVAYDDLRALPGVGDYTAAAIASFGHGRRHVVLDTNVRRVLARLLEGAELPSSASVTVVERRRAEFVLPDDDLTAARWAAATMELGAVLCTARDPHCNACPVRALCTWQRAGAPPHAGPPRRGQTYAGTDRQCRGRLLGVLRDATGPVTAADLVRVWDDAPQRARALDSLVADGLAEPLDGDRFRLPTGR